MVRRGASAPRRPIVRQAWYNNVEGGFMTYIDELNSKTKAELVETAKDYGLPVAGKNKEQLADSIFRFESGVASEEVEIKPVEKKIEKKEDLSDLQLIKFTGTNSGFQVGEYSFTRKNPFLAVPARIASHAYRKWPQKFRPASPDEVKEYYS
jgi:hypothetical protein